jgi:hypothetical protein
METNSTTSESEEWMDSPLLRTRSEQVERKSRQRRRTKVEQQRTTSKGLEQKRRKQEEGRLREERQAWPRRGRSSRVSD